MPLTAAVYTQSDSWQLMALSVRFFTATGTDHGLGKRSAGKTTRAMGKPIRKYYQLT